MFLSLPTSASIFDIVWTKTSEAAKIPYMYIVVKDIERVCRNLGATPTQIGGPIYACNVKYGDACVIYLPKQPLSDTIEHEEKHCMGYSHD